MTRNGIRLRFPARAAAVAASLLIVGGAVSPTSAQSSEWIDAGGGDFDDSSNWSPADVPDMADETAFFTLPGAYVVAYDESLNYSLLELQVFDGDVTLRATGANTNPMLTIQNATINGGDLTLERVGRTLVFTVDQLLDVDGPSTLSILQSNDVSSLGGWIGTSTGSDAEVIVSGGGSTWNASQLAIGKEGHGTLTIESGGDVNSPFGAIVGELPSGVGEVTVSGNGSTWLMDQGLLLGMDGEGILIVEAGGVVESEDILMGLDTSAQSTLTVTGAGSRVTVADEIFVGTVNKGTLTVEAGGELESAFGVVSQSSGATQSNVTVTGAGSSWTLSDNLEVGRNGPGALLIEAGGEVTDAIGIVGSNSGSEGTVTIRGTDVTGTVPSTWTNSNALFIGGDETEAGGTGTLNVETGGVVDVANELTIWDDGTVNLAGGTVNLGGLVFNGSTFNFGFGSLNFTSDQTIAVGGPIETALGGELVIRLGQHLGIEGVATLLNPLTLDAGTFSVGQVVNPQLIDLQRGTLNIDNQAVVVEPGGPFGDTLDLAANATINVALGVTNHGLVTGDGSLGGPLHNDADGELRAEPGRSLSLTGAGNTNDGQISLFGGLLEFTQDLTNNAGGSASGNGTLIVGGGLINHGNMNFSGAANVVGDVENSPSGVITSSGGGPTTFFDDVVNDGEIRTDVGSFTVFLGGLSGSGEFTGSGTVNPEGVVSPGNSVGTLVFDGDLVFGDGAETVIELADDTQFDSLEIVGSASLSGAIEAILIDGFDAELGDAMQIISAAGGLSGTFVNTSLPSLGDDLLQIEVFYGSNSVTLAVVPSLAGDYNGDGTVDAADFTVWRDTLGQTGFGLAADGTGPSGGPDGIVDELDYQFWVDNFGNSAGGGSAAHLAPDDSPGANYAVPAPNTFALLIVATTVFSICFRVRSDTVSAFGGV